MFSSIRQASVVVVLVEVVVVVGRIVVVVLVEVIVVVVVVAPEIKLMHVKTIKWRLLKAVSYMRLT